MGILKNLARKLVEQKKTRQDYERGERIKERYEERKLTSDERELLAWKEKQRQKRIKQELRNIRKKEQKELWRGRKNNAIYEKNIVKDDRNLFKHKLLFGSGGQKAYKTTNILQKMKGGNKK